jgi:hypothetical protein
MEMNKTIAKSNFKIIKRDMFNEDKVLTYSLVCDECCTYEELMKARCNLCDNEDCIEEVLGEPTEIKTYKLDDGREIQFVLTNVETKHSDMRWIIEWYEGVWTETEPPVKKKKGFVHREVFYDVIGYTDRLRELELDDDNSPIIVGTYECKIVNEHPERAEL